jgi:HD-like signal output (HDOD) protein
MQGTDTVILAEDYGRLRAAGDRLVAELDSSLVDNRLELPSLPEVALKIRKALGDENVSTSEIARLIGTDPALAARILKVANSALFHRGTNPITSLHAAASRLGHRMVRNVALSFAAQQVFLGYASRELHSHVTTVWQHSVHVAALAHMLARIRSKIEPDEGFLAGLLHEVGKLYILMRAKEYRDLPLADPALQAVLAEWHPRVGEAVIRAWDLPAELAAAVGEHQSCGLDAPEPPTLTYLVAVANYLAENSEPAALGDDFHAKAPAFGSLSLDKPTFEWLVRAGDVDIRMLMMAFGV